MNNKEIVSKLWKLCDVLRDDGITYHQYVTELTYILFLKMAKETDAENRFAEGITLAQGDNLTPEEETDCLCRLKNGEQGAKEELVLHNMRLVAHVAKKYVSSEEEQEDLISIGTIGLMKAVDSFRPEYGNKFATYAIRCVDNELLMHLRSKKKQRKEVSMFEPIGTDKEGNQIQLVDVLEFHDKNVADEVTKREQMKKICTFMNDVLSEREAFIIRRRYGIGGNQELTQREIARALGISRSYVSRIEKRALEKLKKVISE